MAFNDKHPRHDIILYDANGNAVSIINDSGTYRLEGVNKVLNAAGSQVNPATQETLLAADGRLTTIDSVLDAIKDTDGVADLKKWLGSTAPTVGQKAMSAAIPVSIASDQTVLPVSSGAAAAATGSVTYQLEDSGGSEDMVVDGSTTPVVFSVDADPTDDIQLSSLRLVFDVSPSLLYDGTTFGKGGGVLTNGVSVDIVANDGTFTAQLLLLLINEDFWRSGAEDNAAGNLVASSLPFGGNTLLKAGTSDLVKVTISDDLTSGARGINYLTATLYGIML